MENQPSLSARLELDKFNDVGESHRTIDRGRKPMDDSHEHELVGRVDEPVDEGHSREHRRADEQPDAPPRPVGEDADERLEHHAGQRRNCHDEAEQHVSRAQTGGEQRQERRLAHLVRRAHQEVRGRYAEKSP